MWKKKKNFYIEFNAKWIFFNPWCWIDLKRCQSASNCVELISTQFSILEMCDCVCLCVCVHVCVCVCVCAMCVCDVCVVCVCECKCVRVCYFIVMYNKMYKKCVVCALHTHIPTNTHSLMFAHTCALTCIHAHINISHPKKVNMRRL